MRSSSNRISSRLAFLALGFALAGAPAALAGQPVSLREGLHASGSITLGDLFDEAGPAAGAVVGFGAPARQNALLDAGEVQRLAHIHGLDWENPRGLRRIIVLSTPGEPSASQAAGSSPSSARMVETLTYARSLAAGEIVQARDLVYAKAPRFSVPSDAPADADTVIGMMAKRPLRSGAPVSAHDMAPAIVIKRDDLVSVAYDADGISLVMQGKAMADASAGQPVSVLNPVSKKVVQAVATGPDQAVVGPEADQARTFTGSAASQFALR